MRAKDVKACPGMAPRGKRVATFLGTALLAAACGDGGPDGSAQATPVAEVRDSAGVTVVTNSGRGAWGADAWRVDEAQVLAPDPARPPTQFGYVADVATDGDTLYVLDQMGQQVRVFGPDGQLARTIGRAGEGPGELSGFAATLFLRRDTLIVADWGRGRLHRFMKTGVFVDDAPLPGAGARSWWRMAGDGNVYYRTLARYTDEDGRWLGRDHLIRVGDGFQDPDTVFAFDYEQTDIGARGAPRMPLVINAPTWDVLPDGRIVWSALADSRLRIHGPDGTLQRLVGSATWTPVGLGNAGRQGLVDLMREKLTMLGGDGSAVEQMEVDYPDHLPVLTTVRAGPEGTIWVQREGGMANVHPMALNTPDPPTGWGGEAWDVLDGDGVLQGTVALSPGTRVTRILPDRIVGVRRDALGQDVVVVWRLLR